MSKQRVEPLPRQPQIFFAMEWNKPLKVVLYQDGGPNGLTQKRTEKLCQLIRSRGGKARALDASYFPADPSKPMKPERSEEIMAGVSHVVCDLNESWPLLVRLNAIKREDVETSQGPSLPYFLVRSSWISKSLEVNELQPTAPYEPPFKKRRVAAPKRARPPSSSLSSSSSSASLSEPVAATAAKPSLPSASPSDQGAAAATSSIYGAAAPAASAAGTHQPLGRSVEGRHELKPSAVTENNDEQVSVVRVVKEQPMIKSAPSSTSREPESKKPRTDASSPSTTKKPYMRRVDFSDFPPELDDETKQAYKAYVEQRFGGPFIVRSPKDFPSYACQRPTLRLHANKEIADVLQQLEVVYRAIGEADRQTALGRALSVVRGWPKRIRSADELKGVTYIGGSTLEVIKDVVELEYSRRLEGLLAVPRVRQLMDLCRIHGVGSAHAKAFQRLGYTSVEQILKELEQVGYFENRGKHPKDLDPPDCPFVRAAKPTNEMLTGLLYFKDFDEEHKMTRSQVEGLAGVVRRAAEMVLTERGFTDKPLSETLLFGICGGYRRGKPESSDVDVLVSCRGGGHRGLRAGILAKLTGEMGVRVVALKQAGAVVGYTTPTSVAHEQLEQHDNMLLLIEFEGCFRRVDVVVPPPEQWAFAVLGWSGSRQLEKELRRYAINKKKMHFSQQALYDLTPYIEAREPATLIHNPNSPDGIFHTEESIWEFLGLQYLPPCLRCA